MKKSDKNLRNQTVKNLSQNTTGERRRTKLKPKVKQKYKPKQVYYYQEDDSEELDLFGYLEKE